MARRPLTERSAQGWAQLPSRKLGPSHKRVYGKKGIAASRAVLSHQFLDENEIEIDHQILEKITEQAISPPATPATRPDPRLSQEDAKIDPPAPVAPVAQESSKPQSGLVSIIRSPLLALS
jgi:hypothetical protein